jgi:hypothetical protein
MNQLLALMLAFALAIRCGLWDVQAAVPVTATFHLALECSCGEQAVLAAGRGAPTRIIDWRKA